ncbi:MAG: hypothetical protein A2525_10685 [Sulfurimonas sp. RIFOXYD12_FULL_36_11]|nr:MAG: hypothetical protein A2525_10685 [Sulfurimonas sp. RIFOXYD12_FULL_36_11]
MITKLKSTLTRPDSLGGFLFALVLSLLFLHYTFPTGFIAGNSSYWTSQHDDITQYIAGFNAYFSEPWHFPLFKIDAFNYPIGTRSTFVDIIPIYSSMLKLFVPQDFFPFNPFGYWIAFSFMMQAVSAWLIIKSLNITSWITLIALSIFLLLFPALLARLGHISLMSHYLILLSFVLYIRSVQKPYQPLLWTALLVVAFYINIYIFTMSLAIFFTTIATNLKKLELKQNLIQLLLPIFLIAATSYLTIFPLPKSGFAQDFGWGYYSMNLLSPFYGGAFLKIPNAEMPGQYEGFNYLGLGLIALFVYALYLRKKYDTDFFKRHRAMLILLLLFFIYALSYKVYIGTFKVLSFSYPSFMDTLIHQFRASGRFFWPVGYAIAIFSIVMVSRYAPDKKVPILLVAVLLQIVDLKERHILFTNTANRKTTDIIDLQNWKNRLGDEVKHIYFYPKFRCSKLPPHDTILPTMLYASQNKITLNTGYIARYQPDCNDVLSEIKTSDFNNSAYLFAKGEYTEEEIKNFFKNEQTITCSTLDVVTVCKKINPEKIQ